MNSVCWDGLHVYVTGDIMGRTLNFDLDAHKNFPRRI